MDTNSKFRVKVTYSCLGHPFYTVLDDTPGAWRYDGDLDECRTVVTDIARGLRPCFLQEDRTNHWVLYALDNTPAIIFELVLIEDVIYFGDEWQPVTGEEVYVPLFGSYGTVRHMNADSAIVEIEDDRKQWRMLKFDQFHKSRRAVLENELNRKS